MSKTLNLLTFTWTFLIAVARFIVAGWFKLSRHHLCYGSNPALEIMTTVLCNIPVMTLQMKTGESLSLSIMFKFSVAQISCLSNSTDISILNHFFSFMVLLIISTREKEAEGKEKGLESSFRINLAQWNGQGNSKGVVN